MVNCNEALRYWQTTTKMDYFVVHENLCTFLSSEVTVMHFDEHNYLHLRNHVFEAGL